VTALAERAAMTDLDVADVQGLVLRGYLMPFARHVGLTVADPAAARAFLGALADGAGVPGVTTGQAWSEKPASCVNVGLTADGLAALGLPVEALATFPAEFRAGAAARAATVGDVGDSAPENWLPWLRDGLHLLLMVSAGTAEALEETTRRLARAWPPGWREVGRHDGQYLPDGTAHFGYRDGFSQPVVRGVPLAGLPDRLEQAEVGDFVLGHPSRRPGYSYPVPAPPELGRNGSFAAFRVLEQDVDAFAEFLTRQAGRTGMSEELIAAKLCGRWRNGVPLALSPDTDTPEEPIPLEAMNDFDHADDERGFRCPIGAHARRMHPRRSRVAGNGGHKHRIVRRGVPYGPPYDPAHPRDGRPRGMLGLFIGASLGDQFEFLMRQWAGDGRFAGLRAETDPILAGPGTGSFTVQHPDGPVVLDGLARFVTTRGGAYLFLPAPSGLRHLAGP